MAKGQVKKAQVQADQMIFALDIGTRSVIGMIGVVEEDKVKIIAIEKEEHNERAMIDGQIENIDKVSVLAGRVKKRLENRLHCKLKKVCVAAAGRALRTRRTEYEIDLPGKQLIDDEVISRLEAGAVGKIEEAFDAENSVEDESRRFYLVGYTVCQYYLDEYRMSSLKDHRGQKVKVDLIATFLPSEVVESLYTTMNKIGLEVVSVTLEPIAAINAVIPENLRLLNLVLVDIGAGTSDIAACTDGSVTGYTMATVAGDEITETIMKEYLVDFRTAESVKAQLEQDEEVIFTDILGFERKASREEMLQCIRGASEMLSKEIAEKVLEVNGGAPSALFLAGGGSKLAGLKEGITAALKMDANRVAIAGNNFRLSAFSDEYDLNNPEYATPLGIAVSSGLNLINDSFRVVLNGRPAKLFRSGSFTALNLLMMNGYNFQDILGRPGTSLAVTVNGKRKVFYGTAAQPASLFINKQEGKLSTIIHAGDQIDFVPAVQGIPANVCLGDIEGASECLEITLNGGFMPLETPLKVGDIIRIRMPKEEHAESEDTEEEYIDEEQMLDEPAVSAEEAPKDSANDDGQLMLEFESEEESDSLEDEYMEEEDTVPSEPEYIREEEAGFKEPEYVRREEPILRESEHLKEEEPVVTEPEYVKKEKPVVTEPVTTEPGYVKKEEPAFREPGYTKEGGTGLTKPENGRERAPVFSKSEYTAEGEPVFSESFLDSEFTEEEEFEEYEPKPPKPAAGELIFLLNGVPLRLPEKPDGNPYYLMDMIQYSKIDISKLKGKINLRVNGEPGMFQQPLKPGDQIIVAEE